MTDKNEALALREEVLLTETGKTRQVLRGKDGKFVRKTHDAAKRSMRSAQSLLLERDEKGQTTEERLLKHLVETALQCSPEDLNAAVKAVEAIQKSAYGKTKDNLTQDESKGATQISVVIIPSHSLMHSELVPAPKEPPKVPSFIEAEVIEDGK